MYMVGFLSILAVDCSLGKSARTSASKVKLGARFTLLFADRHSNYSRMSEYQQRTLKVRSEQLARPSGRETAAPLPITPPTDLAPVLESGLSPRGM
jgi:hypothetical protein